MLSHCCLTSTSLSFCTVVLFPPQGSKQWFLLGTKNNCLSKGYLNNAQWFKDNVKVNLLWWISVSQNKENTYPCYCKWHNLAEKRTKMQKHQWLKGRYILL